MILMQKGRSDRCGICLKSLQLSWYIYNTCSCEVQILEKTNGNISIVQTRNWGIEEIAAANSQSI